MPAAKRFQGRNSTTGSEREERDAEHAVGDAPVVFADQRTARAARDNTVPTPVAEKAMPIAVDRRSRYQRESSAEPGTMPFRLTPSADHAADER